MPSDPRIKASVGAQPDGLLLHQNILWGMFPPHFGMRQYWRGFDSLERWARTDPHAQWWRGFIKDRGGTGFWHETYLAGGGIEAGYLDMPKDIGPSQFAPHVARRGSMFSARRRLGLPGHATKASPLPEQAYDAYITGPGERTTRWCDQRFSRWSLVPRPRPEWRDLAGGSWPWPP